MIRFVCPGCSSAFTVTDDRAGKAGRCPRCLCQYTVPLTPGDAPAGPPEVDYAAAPPPLEILPCPGCGTRTTVLPGEVGRTVQCGRCRVAYVAVLPPPPPPPRPAKSRRNDEDEEDDDRRRATKRRRKQSQSGKPIITSTDGRYSGHGQVTSIVRIGVLKFGLTAGCISAAFELAAMLLYGLLLLGMFGCMTAAAGSVTSPSNSDSVMSGLTRVGGVGFLGWLITTVLGLAFAFIGGFLSGLLFAVVYNLLAKLTGGVQVELK